MNTEIERDFASAIAAYRTALTALQLRKDQEEAAAAAQISDDFHTHEILIGVILRVPDIDTDTKNCLIATVMLGTVYDHCRKHATLRTELQRLVREHFPDFVFPPADAPEAPDPHTLEDISHLPPNLQMIMALSAIVYGSDLIENFRDLPVERQDALVGTFENHRCTTPPEVLTPYIIAQRDQAIEAMRHNSWLALSFSGPYAQNHLQDEALEALK